MSWATTWSVARSPHLDYFKANDIEVLYLVDPIDSFMIVALQEYDGKPLKNVDDAGLDLPEERRRRGRSRRAACQRPTLTGWWAALSRCWATGWWRFANPRC